jgi:hypothetical protein
MKRRRDAVAMLRGRSAASGAPQRSPQHIMTYCEVCSINDKARSETDFARSDEMPLVHEFEC